jgi:hypothetical protein
LAIETVYFVVEDYSLQENITQKIFDPGKPASILACHCGPGSMN